MISNLFQSLDIAHVEALAISLPDATIIHVSQSLLARWNTKVETVIGKPLLKFGTGTFSARQLDIAGGDNQQKWVEVSYSPPLGSIILSTYRVQSWQQDGQDCLILLGQHTSAEQTEILAENEKRLNLAMRSGGYALWDHNYETGKTYNSPEMLELFGKTYEDKAYDFHSFNALIAAWTLFSASSRGKPGGMISPTFRVTTPGYLINPRGQTFPESRATGTTGRPKTL